MTWRIGPKKSIRPIAERPAWAARTTIHEMAHTTHGSVLANALRGSRTFAPSSTQNTHE
jgi:hypothetical protein